MYIFEIAQNRNVSVTKVKRLPLLYSRKDGYYSIEETSIFPHIFRKFKPIILLFEGRTKAYRTEADNRSYNDLFVFLVANELSGKRNDVSLEWVRNLKQVFSGFLTYIGFIIVGIVLLFALFRGV